MSSAGQDLIADIKQAKICLKDALDAIVSKGDTHLLAQVLTLTKDQSKSIDYSLPVSLDFMSSILTNAPPEQRLACLNVWCSHYPNVSSDLFKELITITLNITDDFALLQRLFLGLTEQPTKLDVLTWAYLAINHGYLQSFKALLQLNYQQELIANTKTTLAEANLFEKALGHPDPQYIQCLLQGTDHFRQKYANRLLERITMDLAQDPNNQALQLTLLGLLSEVSSTISMQTIRHACLVLLSNTNIMPIPEIVLKRLAEIQDPYSVAEFHSFLKTANLHVEPHHLDRVLNAVYLKFYQQCEQIAEEYKLTVLQNMLQKYQHSTSAENLDSGVIKDRLLEMEQVLSQYATKGKAGIITFFDESISTPHRLHCGVIKSAIQEFRMMEEALRASHVPNVAHPA